MAYIGEFWIYLPTYSLAKIDLSSIAFFSTMSFVKPCVQLLWWFLRT